MELILCIVARMDGIETAKDVERLAASNNTASSPENHLRERVNLRLKGWRLLQSRTAAISRATVRDFLVIYVIWQSHGLSTTALGRIRVLRQLC
jgi:hypothetical protein